MRGGISVTIKADSIWAIQGTANKKLTFAYGIIWIVGFLGITWGWRRLDWEEKNRRQIISQLQKTLNEVNTLSGLLPICASCKKIRDDKGYWTQIEGYLLKHSEARFTHGFCPDCAKKALAELNEEIKKTAKYSRWANNPVKFYSI